MQLDPKYSRILLLLPMIFLVIFNYPGRFSFAYIIQLVAIAVIFMVIIFSKKHEPSKEELIKKQKMFYIAIALTFIVALYSFLQAFNKI